MQSTAPDLRRVIGALIYGAPEPVTVKSLRKILRNVAASETAAATESEDNPPFSDISENEVREAIDGLRRDLEDRPAGIQLVEIAEGYRFFTDPECAPWMRHVLQTEKPARLSPPALETLAIIAYRQPVARSEIEGVRGVSVDHVVRNLMELQLVRIVGRSELPGKPMLYGTTQRFLDHFGLKELRDLPGVTELARRDRAAAKNERETQETATETEQQADPSDDPREQAVDGGDPDVSKAGTPGPQDAGPPAVAENTDES